MTWLSSASLGSWLGLETQGHPTNLQRGLTGMSPEVAYQVGQFLQWSLAGVSAPPQDSRYRRGGYDPARDHIGPSLQDIWGWLNSPAGLPQMQGQQPSQQGQGNAQAAPPTSTIDPKSLPPGADPATVEAVIRAARDVGVDPALALAIAMPESGLRSMSELIATDNGASYGPFQLNANGGQGTGLSMSVLTDAYESSKIALQEIKRVHDQHPDWSPGDIAVAAQRPREDLRPKYISDINNYYTQIQTGQGAMAGLNPYAAGRSAAKNLPGADKGVPLPFPADAFYRNVTQRFREVPSEAGVDIAMDPGTQIISPVGGTIHLEDRGQSDWGKRVFVKTPGGWMIAVGHMTAFTVEEGQQVSVGAILGLSGGAKDDPSSGETTGPHIEFQILDPQGQYIDPYPALQQLFKGIGFDKWMGGVFQSSTGVAGQPQKLQWTPDHRLIDANSPMGNWYQTVDQAWTSIYGVHAPLAAAEAFRHAGVETTDQLKRALDQFPSSIPGVNVGRYQSVNKTLQSMMQQKFGRPAPESMLADFIRRGITGASDMDLWYAGHSSADIPKDQYQSVYDAAAPYVHGVWSDVPHPDDVAAAWKTAGGGA